MPTEIEPHPHYGVSQQMFAVRKPNDSSIVIGGLSVALRQRWTRVLSRRAAGLLWVYLAQLYDPETTQQRIAGNDTQPMREPALPTITTAVMVDALDDGGCEIIGKSGERRWAFLLSAEQGRLFWAALGHTLGLSDHAGTQ